MISPNVQRRLVSFSLFEFSIHFTHLRFPLLKINSLPIGHEYFLFRMVLRPDLARRIYSQTPS